MSSGETTPALDYAPAPRIARRRIVISVVILGPSACAFVGWRWGPAWWDRAKLLYAQRQVMNYDPPADRIVSSSVAEDVKSLPADSSYLVMRPAARFRSGHAGKSTLVQRLDHVGRNHAEWLRFPAGVWQPGPAFLHRLVSASGERRLVVLELSTIGDDLMIYCRNLKPLTWVDDGDVLRPRANRTVAGVYHIKGFTTKPTRMYAGRADANDTSAFSIRVDSDGKSGFIYGRLGDNGKVMLYVTEPWLQDRWGSGSGQDVMIFASPTTQATRGPSRNSPRKLFGNEPQTPRP